MKTMITLKCHNCGASLDFESDREFVFCQYCGSKILIKDGNSYTYRHIDEADVKRAETERLIQMKEMEIEEKEKERKRKGRRIAYAVALVFVIVGCISLIIDSNNLMSLVSFVIGGWIAIFAVINGTEDKKKHNSKTVSNEIIITSNVANFYDENYKYVVAMLKQIGFSKIQAIPLEDLGVLQSKKDGCVETVMIDGCDDFDEGDSFPKNASVIVSYHSKK